MDQKGQYQSEIDELDNLSIIDYERIFKLFIKSENDKDYYFYNILKKIEFPVLDEEYLGYYEVKSNTPLTKISYDIYDDIKSWWLIYLMNKDAFTGIPFVIKGGTTLKYILRQYRSQIYLDITKSTIFAGRHY
jgi:hypothetical protein